MDGEWLLIGSLIAGGLVAGTVAAKRISEAKKTVIRQPPPTVVQQPPPSVTQPQTQSITQTQPVLTPQSVQYPQTQLQSHVIQPPITIGHTEKPPTPTQPIPLPPPGQCWGPTPPSGWHPGMPPIYLPQIIICNFPIPQQPYSPGTIRPIIPTVIK